MPTSISVEGSWKEFQIRNILPPDYSEVLEHVRNYFLKEEPTCKLLGYTEPFANQVLQVVNEVLKQNLSFLAEHAETKELAAVRITVKQTKDSDFNFFLNGSELIDSKTDVFLNSIDISQEEKEIIFKKFKVEEYVELFIVATKPKFRNQGLCSELYKRSMQFLKADGFKLVKCIFTSPATRRAGLRMGFEDFSKIDYATLKDRNGKLVFTEEQLHNEHFALVSLKQL